MECCTCRAQQTVQKLSTCAHSSGDVGLSFTQRVTPEVWAEVEILFARNPPIVEYGLRTVCQPHSVGFMWVVVKIRVPFWVP